MQYIFIILMSFCLLNGFEKRAIVPVEIPNVFIKKTLVLEMIFNDRAKINGEWYRANDVILDFKIKRIDLQNVVLIDRNNKEFVLGF